MLAELAPMEQRGAFMALNGSVLRLGRPGPVVKGGAFVAWAGRVFWASAALALAAAGLIWRRFAAARARGTRAETASGQQCKAAIPRGGAPCLCYGNGRRWDRPSDGHVQQQGPAPGGAPRVESAPPAAGRGGGAAPAVSGLLGLSGVGQGGAQAG
jgi:hypothetical protein